MLDTEVSVPFSNPPGHGSRLKQLIPRGQEMAYGRDDEVELDWSK
jgi:hypothetical protein